MNQSYAFVSRQKLRILFVFFSSLLTSVAVAQPALQLPFFDDFASAAARQGSTQPDPARWLPDGGVYINNTLAINQPSINVATFDGLQANGRPYVLSNLPLDQGYTDVLTSRPINLAGLSAANNVYLSFYWQSKGLGELPDPGDTLAAPAGSPPVLLPGDSLTLQFQDATGTWRTVWGQAGGRADSTFNQAFVQVTNPAFFNANFAFRFRTFGRRSGPFDTWHVDYIYLNRDRNPADRLFAATIDVATGRALSPLLKRYTAMPMAQYKARGANQSELADTVSTVINNLINNPNPISARFTVRDDVSGAVLQQQTTDTIFVSGFQRRTVVPRFTVDANQPRASLRYELALQTSDNQNQIFLRSDPRTLLRNDTISAVATLDDYYAYDDGSWEYAQQIRQREQIAIRFVLNKPDTIGAVRACIVPFTTNQTGQPFSITVYADNNGRPGIALYQQSFPIQYPATRNGFVEYKFARNIPVNGTFYVGYQQISSDDTTFLRLGFDKNSPFGENIFYNSGANWAQNLQRDGGGNPVSALQVAGAFMLRPVMGFRNGVITATTAPEPLAPLRAFPNPTTGMIRWDNPALSRLEVVNLSGQTVLAHEPSRGQQTLDLSHLPDGLYLLRLFANGRTAVQKLIIQH